MEDLSFGCGCRFTFPELSEEGSLIIAPIQRCDDHTTMERRAPVVMLAYEQGRWVISYLRSVTPNTSPALTTALRGSQRATAGNPNGPKPR